MRSRRFEVVHVNYLIKYSVVTQTQEGKREKSVTIFSFSNREFQLNRNMTIPIKFQYIHNMTINNWILYLNQIILAFSSHVNELIP